MPNQPKTHRFTWTDRRITVAFAMAGVVVGVFSSITAGSFLQSQDNGIDLDKQNEVLSIIKDSVDPGGKRFQRGQQQTAAAVQAISSAINEFSTLGAYCAQLTPKDLKGIQSCVKAEYAKLHP